MAKFKALSRGTQLVLVSGPLLLLSLFFTWQHVEVDYGQAGTATIALDGFDAWGLLLALLTCAFVTIVALRALSEVEMSDDLPWSSITLGLGLGVLAVAVLKNLIDAGSTWASYGFVGLAGLVAFGAFLDWSGARGVRQHPELTRRRRGLRSAA
jgi:hypothetical protein